MISGKEYVTQTSVIGSQRFLSQVLALIYWVFITSLFTLHEIGIIATLAILVNIGEPVALVRLYTYAEYNISHSLGEGRWDVIHGTVRRTLGISLLIGLGIGIVFLIFAGPTATALRVSTEYILLVRLTGIAIITSPLVRLGRSFLNGLLRGYAVAYLQFVQPLTLLVSAVILFPSLRLVGLPLAWIISSVTPFLVSLYFVRDVFTHPSSTPSVREIFAFSLPLCGSGVVRFFSRWIDKILVLIFLGVDPLGLYYLILKAINLLRYLTSTLLILFFPTMCSALEHSKNKAQTILSKIFKFVFALVLPFLMLSSITVFPFFSLIFFGKVAGGQFIFTIICLVFAFDNFREILEFVLLAGGYKNVPLQQSMISFLVRMITLSILFLVWPVLEVIGLVYIIEVILTTLFIVICFKKQMSFTIPSASIIKIILASVVITLGFFAVSTILLRLELIILTLGCFVIGYFVLLSIFRTYSDEDLEFLKNVTPKLLHPLIRILKRLRV